MGREIEREGEVEGREKERNDLTRHFLISSAPVFSNPYVAALIANTKRTDTCFS